MLYNKGNHAKLKYVQLQPSPSRVKMVAKFIRRGIRVSNLGAMLTVFLTSPTIFEFRWKFCMHICKILGDFEKSILGK